MPLSEFMPYGAPELLDGARTRMARSTLFASLAVAMLVAGVGSLASRGARLVDPIALMPRIDIMAPPADPAVEYHTPSTEPAPPRADATALPVPDRLAPVEAPADVLPLPAGPVGDAMSSTLQQGSRLSIGGEQLDVDPPPGVYDPSVDEFPVLARSVDARYPDFAREAGVEGLVRVLILVERDGRVKRAIIAPGGSVPMLDDAALDAARRCVFTPALSNGHPVKVWVSRNYRFSLH